MSKEVGKIENNEVCFLNLNFTINALNSDVSIDLDYDRRIIKNRGKLEEVSREFLDKIEDIIVEDFEEKEGEDNE